MAQVFDAPAVLGIRLALIGAVLAVAAAAVLAYQVLPAQSGPLSPQQPIPFSHKHHAGDDGIDCRYCHYSVEKSSFAGIPSTEVCLTCHSRLFNDAPLLAPLRESARTGKPLAWVRVHDLPDFVFFDHSIHIAKGLACSECHGAVERMPRIERVASLEMQWCVGCHRRMARSRGLDERRMTDCSTCHR
jgi:cytochrome c7-like protein/class III cytochrome C family protein